MRYFLPVLLFVPQVAWAHAHLTQAVPEAGSMVAVAPVAVALAFSERLEPRFSQVTVTDAAGASVVDGPMHGDPGDAERLRVPLRKLGPGTYTVHWRAVSVDTHRTQGTYRFTVAP
jgi:methionine-rich copper-binding protein CopC